MHPTYQIFLLSILLISSCGEKPVEPKKNSQQVKLFTKLEKETTGVNFKNDITDSREFNYLFYQYMYNGGGVGAGDFNNDGLVDLYFTANQKSNKLYLNKGDFEFEDITKNAGVGCYENWSNGVSVIDINADGWLDIYVCNSASPDNNELRSNKLFINNKDLTFTESSSQWGIADPAYSNQAYFLDFDRDGDLDMYLVNHRIDFKDNLKTDDAIEKNFSPLHSDKMYRNEGTHFIDITEQSGVQNHAWGLSASIGDFNNDGWQDIYVCNDFVQPDYLYINQKNGTFKDEILDRISHTSFYSMGSDFEDINNDGLADLFVADMVSQNHERSIRNMAAMDSEEFNRLDEIGYGKQYMFNMLQLNQGNGEFAEIAQVAGLSKTDWSWAPLIVDFDNDGLKDVFITNGIKRDVTDIDYKEEVRMRAVRGNAMGFEEVFNSWPSTRLKNYVYRNKGDLKFEDVSKKWGLDQAQNSNGAVYADLDNDGDYDLVLNNMDSPASIYKNNSANNFLKLRIKNNRDNTCAQGLIIEIGTDGEEKQVRNTNSNKGYLSSQSNEIIFGLGDQDSIKHLFIHNYVMDEVISPIQSFEKFHINKTYDLNLNEMTEYAGIGFSPAKSLLKEIDFVNHSHSENEFNDFENEVLLPQKQSNYDACTCVADFNGNGLDDFFVGNALGEIPGLYTQDANGQFKKAQTVFWNSQSKYEDQACLALDYDRDGDMDLLVGSGAYEVGLESELAEARLYVNDGSGNFSSGLINFRSNISSLVFNNSDLVFFAGRTMPGNYPLSSPSALYRIVDNKFDKIESSAIPKLGIVNDAIFSDYDNDGDEDLIVVGEWMPITIILNENGDFENALQIENSSGWWNSISQADLDNDGDLDYILGNLGENNKYLPSPEQPFHVYSSDFDGNGSRDIVLTKQKEDKLLPARGRECSSEQIPSIKERFPTYTQFGKADILSIYGADKIKDADHFQVETFSTSILVNNEGALSLKRLPSKAQLGPTFSVIIDDVNGDGHLDLVGAGNLWDAEAETISYDANRGYILLGDGKLGFSKSSNSVSNGFYYNSNARDLDRINISGQKYILLTSNDDQLRLFKYNEQ